MVVKTISIVVKINIYCGKHQFQEDQAIPQATPNSLKPPLIGHLVMAGSHLSKLRAYKISYIFFITLCLLFSLNVKVIEKLKFPREEKICMVVKINFHGGKNQFSSPLTLANFRACTRAGCRLRVHR